LLTNAVKFTPNSGRVTLSLERESEEAVLTVEDTGQGIEPDFLPQVFEMFRQADAGSTRTHGGMGIGLALVRQLTELHGGVVTAPSEGVGRGARFVVRLPLYTATPFAVQEPVAPPERGLAGTCILVVDDTPDTYDMLRVLLESEGAEVVTAASG